MVNTVLAAGSLVKWIPIKVACTSKIDKIWVVYCFGIGSIQLDGGLYHPMMLGESSNSLAGCLKKKFCSPSTTLRSFGSPDHFGINFVLRNAYRSWFAGFFFVKKWPVFQVKNLTLNKNLWHSWKYMYYMNVEKFKQIYFFLLFVIQAPLAMLTTFRHPVIWSSYLKKIICLCLGSFFSRKTTTVVIPPNFPKLISQFMQLCGIIARPIEWDTDSTLTHGIIDGMDNCWCF